MAYNGNNNNSTPPINTGLLERKLALEAPNPDGKTATLAFTVVRRKFLGVNPAVRIRTRMSGDRDEGSATCVVLSKQFWAFMELIKAASVFVPTPEAPEYKEIMKVDRPNFQKGGGAPQGQVPDYSLIVGKDKDGVVWISLKSNNITPIKFRFLNDEMYAFQHGTGESWSNGEISPIVARGYVSLVTSMIPQTLEREFVPYSPNNNGGGNNGNNNRGNNGGGNNNSSNDDFSDDIPF